MNKLTVIMLPSDAKESAKDYNSNSEEECVSKDAESEISDEERKSPDVGEEDYEH